MSKFTAGPWVAECVACGGDYSNPIDVYEVNNGYSRICEHCIENDARLIAAAPELLAALEAILHAADENPFNPVGHLIEHGGTGARAALRKARGE